MTNTAEAFITEAVKTLSPEYAAKAKRGAEIKALLSALKKELEPIDTIFKGLFEQTGQRTFLAPGGEIACTVDYGSRMILDQPSLKAQQPETVAAFQTKSEWNTPNYK